MPESFRKSEFPALLTLEQATVDLHQERLEMARELGAPWPVPEETIERPVITRKFPEARALAELPPCCMASLGAHLSEILYVAWCIAGATPGRNTHGTPLPTWTQLTVDHRLKWELVAETALDLLSEEEHGRAMNEEPVHLTVEEGGR